MAGVAARESDQQVIDPNRVNQRLPDPRPTIHLPGEGLAALSPGLHWQKRPLVLLLSHSAARFSAGMLARAAVAASTAMNF